MRIAFDHEEVEDRAIARGQLLDQRDQLGSAHGAHGLFIRGMQVLGLGKVQAVVERLVPADLVQCGVHHRPRDPPAQGAVRTEVPDLLEHLHKAILEDVLCLFTVGGVAHANAHHFSGIGLVKRLLGDRIPLEAAGYQLLIRHDLAFAMMR